MFFDTGSMVTRLAPAECERLLLAAIEPDGMFVEMRGKISKPVLGQVGNGRFMLRRPMPPLGYQNSFRPVLKGKLVNDGSETRIEYRFGFRRSVEVVFPVLLVFATLMAVGTESVVGFILPVAGVAIAAWGYHRDSDDLDYLRGFLRDTLSARDG